MSVKSLIKLNPTELYGSRVGKIRKALVAGELSVRELLKNNNRAWDSERGCHLYSIDQVFNAGNVGYRDVPKGKPNSGDSCYYLASCQKLVYSALPLIKNKVVYDLGSGRGLPTLCFALAGAKLAKGVEWDKRRHQSAVRTARKFQLDNIEFINADVREVDYSDGEVFYMFLPFWGAIMDEVLVKLKKVAETKEIVIYSRGNEEALRRIDWLTRLVISSGQAYVADTYKSTLHLESL